MFKNEPIKYALLDRHIGGEYREKTDSIDYTMISIWRIGGEKLHYSRLSDVIIPFPPADSDQKFYASHSGDAIYYLSKNNGKQCIVTVQLGDFCWRVHDFESKDIPKLPDLKLSSMICDNRVLVINLQEGLTKKKYG